jgi:transcription elongation GreA/GreB family factor
MKEREDLPAVEIALDQGLPRQMTAAGRRALSARIAALPAGPERAALERRLDLAVVPETPSDQQTIGFGATVDLEDPAGTAQTFTIVGEDEIDIERGSIGIASPLAQALLGKHAGSIAFWQRPAGNRKMKIRSVSYGE